MTANPKVATSHNVDNYQLLRHKIYIWAKRSPALLALLIFGSFILIITSFLTLPIAATGPGGANFLSALFTATSAVCVTGLTVVDTASYWTPFGKTVIALGAQVGGLGVMTLASLLGLAVSRHLGFTSRFLTANETKSRLGEVALLLRAVVITSLTMELILTFAFLGVYLKTEHSLLEALGHSAFFAISTFNNAGFVSIEGGLAGFVGNWGFGILVILGTIIGAIGFPVILNLATHKFHVRNWSLHTKLTLTTYFALLGISIALIALLEWTNSATFGELNTSQKLLASAFHATTARSSGLATLDLSNMHESTWLVLDILMFIGGGSAGTGGGIKVTTFAVLILAIIAEARGDQDTECFGKRLAYPALRLAISVTLLGAVLVGSASLIILHLTGLPLSMVLFEVISAFATCGLSTGITAQLPASAQIILIVMMYLGRVGTMTFAAALALRTRPRVIRYPEDRPLIG